MTVWELKRLVAKGEGQHIEFKRRVSFPEKILKEMIAFANSTGGTLLLGVNDEGHLSGLKYPEEEIYVLTEALRRLCKPQLHYEIEVIPLTEYKSIVSFFIPESQHKPHYLVSPEPNAAGIAYVRREDRSIKASKELRQILRRKHQPAGVRFHYGDSERKLLSYLRQHGEITLREYASMIEKPLSYASRTLILLVLANVLELEPREEEDVYILTDHDG